MAAETSEPTFADLWRPEALPERIASLIREAIIEGRWEPGGRLVESQLARQFGVSRAPLREALRLLVAERLVAGLLAWGNQRLGKTQRVSAVGFREEFLRNTLHKVLKRELRAPYRRGRERDI